MMSIFDFFAKLFGRSETSEQSVSSEMQSALSVWLDLYQHGGGTSSDSRSLNLPAAICSEFTRLMMAESVIGTAGDSARSQFLDEQLRRMLDFFRIYRADAALALGSMAFKPYVSGKRVFVDQVRADRYVPTAFDDAGEPTAAIFMARKFIGHRYYTRLETHTFHAESQTYTVENRAYCSLNRDSLGYTCSLNTVDDWAGLQEEQTISNVTRPLFSVFRVPAANTVDLDSVLGVSVFASADELIADANAQWARILWEFKGTELAVDASEMLFRRDRTTRELLELPAGSKRLFRKYPTQDKSISEIMQTFSPQIRDESLLRGLNRMLRQIEFNVGLAYGTLSDPADTDKTAEEVRASKQRSYVQVSALQSSLQTALEGLLYAMDAYTSLYDLAPSGKTELTCTWGDSVLEDTDKEYQRRMQMVTAGMLRSELFVSWYFGCSAEDARLKYMPDTQPDLFGSGVPSLR